MTTAEDRAAIDMLSSEIADLKGRVDNVESGGRATQLQNSSMDVNLGRGYIPVYDGEVERVRIGRMPDGTVAVVAANNFEPPSRPKKARVTSIIGGAEVTVTDLAGDIPYDFGYIKVWVDDLHVGNIIRIPGSLIVAPFEGGTKHKVELSGVNTSGTESIRSEPAEFIADSVVSGINFEEITEVLIADDAITSPKITAAAILAKHVMAGAIEADAIRAGSVTAAKLEAILAIVTRLVAGDPVAQRAELSKNGFEQYGPTGQLLIQFGSNPGMGQSNIITIVDASDPTRALATLDAVGILSTSGINVSGQARFNGRSLDEILYQFPLGVMAYGVIPTNTLPTTSTRGLYELAFDAVAGRTYRFATSSFYLANTGAGVPAGAVEIRYTVTGARPTTSSTLMADASTFDDMQAKSSAGGGNATLTNGPNNTVTNPGGDGGGALHQHGMNHNHAVGQNDHTHFTLIPQVGNTVVALKTFSFNARIRVLFCLRAYYGSGISLDTPNGDAGIQFYVEDVGPAVTASGGSSDGSGSGAGGTGFTTTTFPATWTRTWRTSNLAAVKNTGLEQGTDPNGEQRVSMIGFNSIGIQQALDGAQVAKIELYLYAQNWDTSTGGTVVVGTHAETGPPTSYNYYTRGVSNIGLGRPEGRWTSIAIGLGAFLKDGRVTGIVLDPRALAGNSDPKYSGVFAGASDPNYRPQLRITYQK